MSQGKSDTSRHKPLFQKGQISSVFLLLQTWGKYKLFVKACQQAFTHHPFCIQVLSKIDNRNRKSKICSERFDMYILTEKPFIKDSKAIEFFHKLFGSPISEVLKLEAKIDNNPQP